MTENPFEIIDDAEGAFDSFAEAERLFGSASDLATIDRAVVLYKFAAHQGHMQADFRLGEIFAMPGEPWTNTAASLRHYRSSLARWLLKYREDRLRNAAGWIASFYHRGLGVPVNYELAAKWYLRNADDACAARNIGMFHARGLLIASSDEMAICWLRRASLLGDAAAQYDLGYGYQFGKGVAVDVGKARMLYSQSYRQGNMDVAKRLMEVGGDVSDVS